MSTELIFSLNFYLSSSNTRRTNKFQQIMTDFQNKTHLVKAFVLYQGFFQLINEDFFERAFVFKIKNV